MIIKHLLQLLPLWPVVPLRLWLTAGLGLVAAANLVFRDEIWPHTPGAEAVGWPSLLIVCVACLLQVAAVLNQWGKSYAGPRWAQLGFRLCIGLSLVGCLAVATVMLLAFIALILIEVAT